jgi:hypothetical protein
MNVFNWLGRGVIYLDATWNDVRMPRPATGETTKRAMRIEEEIWNPAQKRASSERPKRTMTRVVKDYLRRYGARLPADADEFDPWDLVNVVMRELGERSVQARVGPDTDLQAAAEAAADLLRTLGIKPAASPAGKDRPPDGH